MQLPNLLSRCPHDRRQRLQISTHPPAGHPATSVTPTGCPPSTPTRLRVSCAGETLPGLCSLSGSGAASALSLWPRGLDNNVEAPACHRAVGLHPAGVDPPGADRSDGFHRQLSGGRCGLNRTGRRRGGIVATGAQDNGDGQSCQDHEPVNTSTCPSSGPHLAHGAPAVASSAPTGRWCNSHTSTAPVIAPCTSQPTSQPTAMAPPAAPTPTAVPTAAPIAAQPTVLTRTHTTGAPAPVRVRCFRSVAHCAAPIANPATAPVTPNHTSQAQGSSTPTKISTVPVRRATRKPTTRPTPMPPPQHAAVSGTHANARSTRIRSIPHCTTPSTSAVTSTTTAKAKMPGSSDVPKISKPAKPTRPTSPLGPVYIQGEQWLRISLFGFRLLT